MRKKRTNQMSIYEIFADHEIATELNKISNWLDTHTEVLDWVEADIQRKNLRTAGRSGMTIESVLRSGFLLRYWRWTYEELAFHLMDSAVNLGFARLPREFVQGNGAKKDSTSSVDGLHRVIGQLTAERDFLARKLDQ
jgi:transposase, IS5 family